MNHRLLILGWHNVEPTPAFPSRPTRGASGLLRQLRAVRRFATVVDLDSAVADLVAGRPLPPRAVALTFDDGYRDNLTVAVPMLHDLGLPATFFLIPSVLDGAIDPWWERLALAFDHTPCTSIEWDRTTWSLAPTIRRNVYDEVCSRLKQFDQPTRLAEVDDLVARLRATSVAHVHDVFLDWGGAHALAQKGVSIGAHSDDHAILANETPEVQRRNLAGARRRLEDGLGMPINGLAYPNGTPDAFNDDTVDAARAAGYAFAVSTIPGWNVRASPTFALRRQVMYPESGIAGFKPLVKPALREFSGGVGTAS